MDNYLCIFNRDLKILEWFYEIDIEYHDAMIEEIIQYEKFNVIIDLYNKFMELQDIFIYFGVKHNNLPLLKYIYNKLCYLDIKYMYYAIKFDNFKIIKWCTGIFRNKIINRNVISYSHYYNPKISSWLCFIGSNNYGISLDLNDSFFRDLCGYRFPKN